MSVFLSSLRLFVLILLTIFLPWAFGTVESWSIEIACCLVICLFILVVVDKSRNKNLYRLGIIKVVGLILLFYFSSYLVVSSELDIFGVNGTPMLEKAHSFLPSHLRSNQVYHEFFRYFFVMLLALSVFCADFSAKHKKIFLMAIIVNALLLVFIAILQKISGTEELLWFRPLSWRGDAITPVTFVGPFVNRNHFSAYINIIFPFIWVLWVWIQERYQLHDDRRNDVKYLIVIIGLVLSGGVFLSASRGGLLILFFELCLMFFITRKYLSGINWIFLTSVSVVFLFCFILFGGDMSARVSHSLFGDSSQRLVNDWRWLQYQDSLKMFFVYPVMGWGLGSFSIVYPFFKSPEIYLKVEYVHNDYLQFLVETGVIGLSLCLLFLTLITFKQYTLVALSHDRLQKMFVRAGMVSFLGFCIYAMIDFPFQMYGLLMSLAVIIPITFFKDKQYLEDI